MPTIRCRRSTPSTAPTQLAKGDIGLTYSLLTFARHLSTGRIAPRRVFAQVEYGNHTPDPDAILKTVFAAQDVDAAIESYDPPDAGFRALKQKLAELRSQSGDSDANRIPNGPPIASAARTRACRPCARDFGLKGKPDDLTYDRRLYNAIRRIQHNDNLRADRHHRQQHAGVINGPTHAQVIDTVMANMERWRWLPRDLGDTYVMVNVPDFTLKLVSDHRVVWRTKIVAGKPQTPTPLVSASMDQVIVNPSWYVPQSIIHNELLPRYESDPNIFDRMGLEVKKGPDGHINVVQPPGAANALGRIKFNFHNKFQVYLHDTPEKRLFSYDKRAFSHGCMRVQDPTKFGELILSLAMNGRDAERAPDPVDVRPGGARLQTDANGRWCTSPTRPPSSTRPASCNCVTTSTASTPASTPSSTAPSAGWPTSRRRRTRPATWRPRRPTRKSCAGSSAARPAIRSPSSSSCSADASLTGTRYRSCPAIAPGMIV